MADFDRAALVEYGKKLVNAGLTKGTGGNLSLFDRERGLMAITPSGIDFFGGRGCRGLAHAVERVADAP